MTMNKPIYITDRDARRLRSLLKSNSGTKGAEAENLKRLEKELDRAQILLEGEVPPGLITMNSTVELEDLSDGEISTFTLVYPEDADVDQGRISIMAPLGTAMLGFKVGDQVDWPVPSGTIHVRVRRLLGKVDLVEADNEHFRPQKTGNLAGNH
jgi:regulator of nucleoside diphosphate kinase